MATLEATIPVAERRGWLVMLESRAHALRAKAGDAHHLTTLLTVE
jgi:hypothetical protein